MKNHCRFLLLVLIAASMLLTVSCGDKKKKKTDFIYKITDGYATVVGYSGIDSEIVIPKKLGGKTVTKIEENSFKGMIGLKKVTIPDTVKEIDHAFTACPDLLSVDLGSGIQTMNGAFKDCPKLETVSGGESAVMLSEAFMNCVSLKKGYIPSNAIDCDSAFRGCKALVEVKIGEGTTSLPFTFEGCTSLTEVALPTTVSEPSHTFENCSSLTSVTGCEGFTALENTFAGCTLLTSVALGENVTVLKGAFLNCSSLSSVSNLPTEVESYSPSFTGCTALSEMVIPKMSESEAAAYDLSSDVKGCAALTKLTVNSTFFVTREFCTTFAGCSSIREVNIPKESAEAFLRVDASYYDKLFTGKYTAVSQAVNSCKKATALRVTPSFGYVGETAYTHVSGGDVDYFVYQNVASDVSVHDFTPFTKSYYWCGYPNKTNRKTATVAIERVYNFYLRVTGTNDGTLPSEVTVNGLECTIEDK